MNPLETQNNEREVPFPKLSGRQNEVARWFQEQGWEYWENVDIVSQLAEEIGELAKVLKHEYGAKKKREDERQQLPEDELGDVLYAILCFANKWGITLDDLLDQSPGFDGLSAIADARGSGNRLFAAAGRFAEAVEQFKEDNPTIAENSAIRERVANILHTLHATALACDTTIDIAIEKTFAKIMTRDKDRYTEKK